VRRPFNIAALLSLLGATTAAFGFDFADQPIEVALHELEARGLSILYSSDLIKPGMRVLQAPAARSPRQVLEEIVRPHGIRVVEGPGGMLLLTRAKRVASPPSPVPAEPALAEIVVTASRYAWVRIAQPSLTRLSEAELHLAPNVGDDPLRTIARLPGAVGSDLSARLNVRGGAADETLVRFDGLRLMNPFHLKDFQSIFSAINPALVGAVEVYTGGFPVSFGDRMSGVIDIHPVRAEAVTRRELAVSLYNASALAASRFDRGRGDWVVSARRGNLDRVLDWSGMQLGEPAYSDFYAHFGHRIGDSLSVSGNLLRFDDDIELADSDVEEQADARYRDRYIWLRLDAHPRESLMGSVLVARTDLDSVRRGEAEQPGISRGSLEDRREFSVQSLQADWSWRAADAAALQFGGEWRRSEGRYRYRDEAEFDLIFDIPGALAENSRAHDIDHRTSGEQYGAYASLRTEVSAQLTLEGGVRWDRSTLGHDDGHWSPRASALFRLGESSSVRASWGRFMQTQNVDELAVPDGIVAFGAAQRADHWLVSFEQHLNDDVDLRVEAYLKRYSQLQPRFENFLNDVVILPELKPDRIRITPDHGRALGLELSLRSVHARPLFWWASYTWSRAEDVFPTQEVRRSWDQQHALNAGLGWETESWDLSVAGAWRSGRPTTALELATVDDETVVRADSRNTRHLRTYADLDARVARKFRFGGGSSLTAFFELSNALNRRNECCTEFEVDDESGQPELILESIRSLPLLPSVGVVWRF
jgi:outer membrane receptor protein involved in Fe transport